MNAIKITKLCIPGRFQCILETNNCNIYRQSSIHRGHQGFPIIYNFPDLLAENNLYLANNHNIQFYRDNDVNVPHVNFISNIDFNYMMFWCLEVCEKEKEFTIISNVFLIQEETVEIQM